MKLEQITSIAADLVQTYQTRDPFRLAEYLGVHIMKVPDLVHLKGAYKVLCGKRWIFINDNLPEGRQRIVCAHELGHDQLHRALADGTELVEYKLYDMSSRPEYEANIFAAEIALDTEVVLDLIRNYEYDPDQIARELDSDVNLVALKIADMTRQGYALRKIDYKSNFLK